MRLRWWQLLLGLASGYAVFALISKYIFHVCPACAASHFDEATDAPLQRDCLGDDAGTGHPLHGGRAGHGGGRRKSEAHGTGFTIVLAVCVHKIPEGLALGALLLGAGLSRKKIIY